MTSSRTLFDPIIGSRSRTSPRTGKARPFTIMTAMITKKGAASISPVTWEYAASSDCKIPIPSPATRVIQNEENLPISAAAMAATTINVRLVTVTPLRGAMRTPATAASAAPSDQLSVAMRSGDQPSAPAARWFSATADVAKPMSVWRLTRFKPTVRTNPRLRSQMAFSGTNTPSTMKDVVGSDEGTVVTLLP